MPENWSFAVMKGSDPLFQMSVPVHRLAREDVNHIMRMLLAKHALTEEQIISGSLNKRRGGPTRTDHRKISLMRDRNFGRRLLKCGANPFVIAASDSLLESNAAWVSS